MITKSRRPASDDVSDFWQELPGQIQVAVRKVFHWERTDVMSTEEFWERVVARTERNITSAVHRKTAGFSSSDWIAQIRNLEAWLVKVARRAAIDEARKVL